MSIENLKGDLAELVLLQKDFDVHYTVSVDTIELLQQKIAELEETQRIAQNALANATTICAAWYDPKFPDECTDRCK